MIPQSLPEHRFLLVFSEGNIWECSDRWDRDHMRVATSALYRLKSVISELDHGGVIFFAWTMYPDNPANAMIFRFIKTVFVREAKNIVATEINRRRDQEFHCDPKIEADRRELALFSSFAVSILQSVSGGPTQWE